MKNSQNLIIRILQPEDLVQVSTIVKRSMLPSLVSLSDELKEGVFSRNNPDKFLIGREDVTYIIAQQDVRIVGIIGLDKNFIRTFYVDPLFQGRGIGRLLFNHIKKLALKMNRVLLTVQSSPEAYEIYKHFGFIEKENIWKTHPDGNKSYTILMELPLI